MPGGDDLLLDFGTPGGIRGEPFCCLMENLFYCIKKKLYLCKSDKSKGLTVIINHINLILWHFKDKS